jgi:hypothetical protein
MSKITSLSLCLTKGDPIFIGEDLAIIPHEKNRVSIITKRETKIVRYKAFLRNPHLNHSLNEELFNKVFSMEGDK